MAKDEVEAFGRLVVDPRGTVTFDGVELPLPHAQFMVLFTLLKGKGRTVSNATLLERLDSDAESKTIISLYVSKLRKRLEAVGLVGCIENVWSLGYKWVAPTTERNENEHQSWQEGSRQAGLPRPAAGQGPRSNHADAC